MCVLNVRLWSRCRAAAILLEVRELTLKWAVSRRQILNSFQTKGCTLMYWHHIDIIIIKQWLVFKDKCWINSKLYRRRNLLGHPLWYGDIQYFSQENRVSETETERDKELREIKAIRWENNFSNNCSLVISSDAPDIAGLPLSLSLTLLSIKQRNPSSSW